MASSLQAFNPMFSSKDPESASLPSSDGKPHNDDNDDQMVAGSAMIADKSASAQPNSIVNLHKIYIFEYVLLFLCVTFSAVMIAATYQLLHVTPFEPVFWLFVFSMIIYWMCSFTLTFTWMYTDKMRSQQEKVKTKTCSTQAWKRNVRRVEFWLFFASLVCSFACMLLLLRFVMPEAFFPSSDLKLRRLGGVTSDTAAVFIRDPTLGEGYEIAVQYRLSGTNDTFSTSLTKAKLSKASDYTGFVRLTGLTPASTYEWRFETFTQDTFTFKTNPASGQPSKFSFYFGSCFLHNFPNFQEAPGFLYAMELKPDLFTFLGDFIYSDIPYFASDDIANYHSLYRNTLKNSHVRNLMQTIPNYNMWDDHEVRNNFPDVVGSNMNVGKGSFGNAIENGWQVYLGGGNPVSQPGKTYYDFDYGDSSFVFLDTRVRRSSNTLPDSPTKTILGQEQKDYFKAWLLAKNSTSKFKFIMSPLGWTNDFPSVEDSWGGYKTERDELFEFIRENHIEGVVMFSGDSHFAYALELGGAPGGMGGGLYEFSASPISAFDFTLGGFISDTIPFKPEDKREDKILFETIGRKGAMSLLGLVRVDTTLAIPELAIEFYDSRIKIYEMKLTLVQLRPWEHS